MGCEIKAGAVNLVSFWPMLEKSIHDGVTATKTAERHFIFTLQVQNRALACMNNA